MKTYGRNKGTNGQIFFRTIHSDSYSALNT